MNIAIFSDIFFPEQSGITDSIITTARALVARGHTVTFVVPSYSARDFVIARTV
jgi:flavoprotein